MGSIIGLLVAKGIPLKHARPLAFAALALVLLGLLWGAKCAYDRAVIAKHEAKIEARARPATDKAADERARDAIANAKTEEELHAAIAAQPDQAIAPTSRALACARLRKAGITPPAECGPASGR